MAASEDYGIEDITPQNSSESDSDEDDDVLQPRPTGGRMIAHKEMKNIEMNEPIVDDNNGGLEKQIIDEKVYDNEDDKPAPMQTSFEDISDEEEDNEAFSPPEEDEKEDHQSVGSPVTPDLSDDDAPRPATPVGDIHSPISDDNNIPITPVGGSPIDSDVDEHPTIDSSVENENLPKSPDNEAKENSDNEDSDDEDSKRKNVHEGDEDLIDAPIPSPFSDIGDGIGDITGEENAIISDILKLTSSGNHISPELEGFAQSLEMADVPGLIDSPRQEETKKPEEDISVKSEDKLDIKDEKNDKKSEENEDDQQEKTETQQQGSGDVGGLLADIFGDSDDEEEEFEGFGEEDLQPEKKKTKVRAIISDDDDDDSDDEESASKSKPESVSRDDEEEAAQELGKIPMPEDEEDSSDDNRPTSDTISDFDIMMQKKRDAMSNRRRRKRDFDIINDNDDIIAAMIKTMKDAAEEDRMLNQAGRAATKKLKMLDTVVSHLHKSDLQHTFIDGGVLPVMKEWLSPLPDNSLPHIMIRKSFLKLLEEFPALDRGALKMSGIGRSIMLLYKHPKETRENRNIAGKIIAQWARPIFGVQTNFKDMSREEREERDQQNAAEYKKRRLSSTDESPGSKAGQQDDKRPKRPGDKGFIARARVPKASTRDYIVRPKSDVNTLSELGMMKNPKKPLNRFEKQMRKFKERNGIKGSSSRAVSMSLNGSKMTL